MIQIGISGEIISIITHIFLNKQIFVKDYIRNLAGANRCNTGLPQASSLPSRTYLVVVPSPFILILIQISWMSEYLNWYKQGGLRKLIYTKEISPCFQIELECLVFPLKMKKLKEKRKWFWFILLNWESSSHFRYIMIWD